MKLRLAGPDVAAIECDALILVEFEGSPRADLAVLSANRDSGEVTGKPSELTLFHSLAGFKAKRVLLAGGGKREKFDSAALRKLSSTAARLLKGKGVKTAAISLEAGYDSAEYVSAVAQSMIEACWEPDRLKTDADKDGARTIEELIVCATGAASLASALEAGR